MITSLSLNGFKCFSEEVFKLGKLTLMSGLNSSGKSTVIQALRMFGAKRQGESPYLDGYGGYDELRSKHSAREDVIAIVCEFDDGDEPALVLTDRVLQTPARAPITYYLSAARHGPLSMWPLERSRHDWPELGAKGDYLIDFAKFFENCLVQDALIRNASDGLTVNDQMQSWLQEIAPGSTFVLDRDVKRDASFAEINSFRPANVGFGISYVFPILVAILGLTSREPAKGWTTNRGKLWETSRSSDGVMLLVENPEAHLHPRAQTRLAYLIAAASNCGVQVVVETQSDYILDGIRLAVKQGKLVPDDVKIYFLEAITDAPPTVRSPAIARDGRLEFWPTGFFDQTIKNRMDLAE